MTILRLVRRLLLCAIVGVTAFGVSGWLLRPRPSWSIRFDEAQNYHQFVHDARSGRPDEPIWIEVDEQGDVDYDDHRFFRAIDPRTGAVLRTARRQKGFNEDIAESFGDRLVLYCSEARNTDKTGSQFWVLDVDPNVKPVFLVLEGDWSRDDEGLYAWKPRLDDETLWIDRRRLRDGAEMPVKVPGRFGRLNRTEFGYSAEAGLAAFTKSLREGEDDDQAVEVVDVSTGKRVAEFKIHFQEGETPEPPRSIHFWRGGKRLSFWTGTGDTLKDWDFAVDDSDPKQGAFAARPTEAPGQINVNSGDERPEGCVWTANSLDPKGSWIWLQRAADEKPHWRRVPYDIQVDYKISHHHGVTSKTETLEGADAYIVTGTSQLVVQTLEPSLGAMIPQALCGWLPNAWSKDGVDVRYRWHDWDRNGWRDIGCRNPYETQVRGDALLALSEQNQDRTTLECWPLPPRNLKWLAAAIAVVSAAAVWWLCAKRAARMKSLAAA